MKTSSLLFCLMIIQAASVVSGQTTVINSTYDLFTFMNSDLNYLEQQRERYSQIEGSVYADDDFQEGSIFYMQKKFVGLQIRYNTYEGTFEFKTDQGIKYFDPTATHVDTVWIAGKTFPYVLYESGKSRKMTFMEMVHHGTTSVFKYSQMNLIPAKQAKGYEEARPARFDHRPAIIYIQTSGNAALEFKGKKSIAIVFPEHHREMADFSKSNRMKFKKIDEVVRLCNYYDEIR